jgi:dihydroorotate dehydrogenase (NAD+) catalytic subunit
MLEFDLCNVKMKNPTMLAAGILGSTAASMNWVSRNGAGAVVTKSFGLEPNEGYSNPTTVEVTGGIINAIGLSNPGVDAFIGELEKIERSTPTIASIYGSSGEDFAQIAAKIENYADLIELNVSCPHAQKGCGASIGEDPSFTGDIVRAVKKTTDVPVIVKLTPNVTDIVEIARSAEKAGCDGLTLINSLGPGLKIDIETANPILSNKFGGMSGPAIKPIALRCVYDTYDAVKIPIIGVGGIIDYRDAIEFLFAGALCVQIGTAIMFKGPSIFKEINLGIEKFLLEKDYKSIDEMVGNAHK